MIGYMLWTLLIVGGLVVNFGGLLMWYESLPYTNRSIDKVRRVLIVVLAIVSLAFWAGLLINKVAEDEKPPAGIVSWKGGDGPNTKCWYAAEDNPDTLIMAGKVPVVIEGEGTTTFTWCSKDGLDVPESAR